MLFRGVKGCRVGLIVGTLTTLIATPVAILCGITAGYLGGWVDDVIQYIYTTLSSIPSILLYFPRPQFIPDLIPFVA